MADKRIIAVVGATGAQGGGLVRAILNDDSGRFAVRALTRNTGSDKAKRLKQAGAEVVAADLDDVESLKKAFNGAYGTYCVTFYWAHMSPEKELIHARAMAEAAKHEGVEHVIWSTLEDTRKWVPLNDNRMPTLMGKYKVPHFDAKGEADQIFRDLRLHTTFLLTSFYWDNLIYFGMGPKRGPDGKIVLTLPMGDKRLPGIAAEDIGRCAYGIFKKGKEFIGKTVGIVGEQLTGEQMADALSRNLGMQVHYQDIESDAYRGLAFPGAEDLGNMFQFKKEFESYFCAARDIKLSRDLNPLLLSFDDWLAENGHRMAIG
jgi:uncharacterized protein YbjT (DUF2867 family)